MTPYKDLTRYLWTFIRRQKWTFLLIVVLDSLAWPSDALIWPYILRVTINIFTQFDADRAAAWEFLKAPMIAGVTLVFLIESASRLMGFLMAKALPRLLADVRMAMFEHIQHHSPHYFNERFAGSLANRINDMTTQLEQVIQRLFFPFIPALSTCFLGAVFLWHVHPLFSALFLLWITIHLSICLWFSRGVDDLEMQHGEARSTLIGKIVDSFTNNFAVNLFYRFDYERCLVASYQDVEEASNLRAKRHVEKMLCCMSASYLVAVIFGMLGPSIYLWLNASITTGHVIQVFTTMWSLTMLFWTVGNALPHLFQSIGILRGAYAVCTQPQDLGDQPGAKELLVKKGKIAFRDVSFQYSEQELFRNKRVEISPGERVGVVGYTGAGKSTFVNLILRLFPLRGGEITIDGQDIAEVTLQSLRQNIALIPQDPILFHRSLRENILYGRPDASVEELLSASKQAFCDSFIRRLPKGYESKVGERGTKLSGGEKQRIAIARAILADRPILILDEATSALDSVTERVIQESLEALMEGRTTIVIAHRLSTLSRMDRILVFDQGEIVEEGSHDELLTREGHYAKMWAMQAGGFLPEAPH